MTEKTRTGKIVDVFEKSRDRVIIRGVFRERLILVEEDIIVELNGIDPNDFTEGKEIKVIEKDDKIYIIIKKKTIS